MNKNPMKRHALESFALSEMLRTFRAEVENKSHDECRCAKCGADLSPMKSDAREAHLSLCNWGASEMALVETHDSKRDDSLAPRLDAREGYDMEGAR